MPSPTLTTALVLVAAALLTGWLIRRSRRHPGDGQRPQSPAVVTPAVLVAAVAAVACTAYSADTSWRFAADYLGMRSMIERTAMFATAELALFATALMARQNLNGPMQAPGLPGLLVWVITGVQIIPAYAEFGPLGGTIRGVVGPVMAAMLWHLAMGIELRHRTPQATSRSLAAVLAAQARERMLARLGIADQDADAARLIRDRALHEAVTLILRADAMTDTQRTKRRGRRLIRRLHEALERADVDGDPRQDELLLRKLATRKQGLTLASIALPPRWPGIPSGTSDQTARRRISPPADRGTADAGRAHPYDTTDEVHQAARIPPTAVTNPGRAPLPEAETGPEQPASAPPHAEPIPGTASDPNGHPGEPGKPGRRPDVTDEVLLKAARRIKEATGKITRKQLEEQLRAEGLSVSRDRAGNTVRIVKAETNAAVSHPH
ncbi:hypothetical protein GCM10010211_26300 [Streptomyces albospinus]|uniref:DUF2637 domain-containing protein n=1 Tax=Streptomyces albospinus TaxID=285515 RepID=A0ABQ2UYC1_9ACTN|nr:hypothetical protein [Streptomyces albospinus]GGU60016.1 hypothetical protein GCM10010211_26300 [Streptomyces albospinus]